MITIGQLAEATGVPTSTIRFWERRNLLRPDAWQGGQRRYGEDTLTRVGVLRLCQDAGFTLTEIARITNDRARDREEWHALLTAKLASIEESLARLNKAHALLSHAVDCPYDDIADCPDFREAVRHRIGPREAACATASAPREPVA
jgi:DNA-binding transcriptional MerR regulator